MQPSKQDIENAARLVPDTENAWSRARGIPMTTGRQVVEGGAYIIREWQPWADTEAGKADALVLLVAVQTWIEKNGVTDEILHSHMGIVTALGSGSVQQIQAATFAAAVAIGAHTGVSRGQ